MSESFSQPQSVLIIDDHALFREGLVSIFHAAEDFKVVGQAGTVAEGIEKARQLKPDIILMDFSLPDGTGLDATKIILDELPDCKIIFLTIYETDENLLAAIRLGAKGYMLKNVSSSSLLASLRGLRDGEIAMSRKMLSRLLEFARESPTIQKNEILSKLSRREIDILSELEDGSSNAEIAQRLFLSENTVKHYIHSILDKLGLENRRQAAIIARQLGLSKRSRS